MSHRNGPVPDMRERARESRKRLLDLSPPIVAATSNRRIGPKKTKEPARVCGAADANRTPETEGQTALPRGRTAWFGDYVHQVLCGGHVPRVRRAPHRSPPHCKIEHSDHAT